MNHQPFEDWLLEETPLSLQQRQALETHLHVCPSCRALAEVNRALRITHLVDPPPGFVHRFQIRLAAERRAYRRRSLLGWLLLTLSVMLILLGVIWPFLRGQISLPEVVSTFWVSLVNLWVTLQVFVRLAQVFFQLIPDVLEVAIWLTLLLLVSLWGATWAVSFRKFVHVVQGVAQ
ncbi:MAG: hypothetical protein N2049_05470 [Anaerolineales bacterium]|nr:hypothetical protein [Anaerolineales bacterium]MCX7608652.1 hypothetical protein [Anaerolineales bacterium]